MSIFSAFDDPFYLPIRPTRILDQQFALGLTDHDYLTPLSIPNIRRQDFNPLKQYYRPWRSLLADADTGSTINVSKDKFQVNLDVQQFQPNEISVKITGDNIITVEGKHEERPDEHGFISRHFVRKYVVPKSHDVKTVDSILSTDGVLTLTALKREPSESNIRMIPIVQTGKPSKCSEGKNQEKGDA